MSYESLQLHDANLKSTSINYVAKTVALEIEYYPTEQSNNRISAIFQFSDVSDYHENSSVKEMSVHSKCGGNISSWEPSVNAGTTYFYLVQGFISITAKSLVVVNHT